MTITLNKSCCLRFAKKNSSATTFSQNLPTVGDWHLPTVGDWHLPSAPIAAPQFPNFPRAHEEGVPHSTPQTDVVVAEPELAKPPMYAVVMYNDNYTPMEFVVYVLQAEFKHSLDRAVEIMLTVHNNGKGIAGIYPKDIAETKAKAVNSLAHREGYPLLTQIEPHQGE